MGIFREEDAESTSGCGYPGVRKVCKELNILFEAILPARLSAGPVYCCMLGGTFSEPLAVSCKARFAGNGAPFPRNATPQMAGQRLARREPPKNAMTALRTPSLESALRASLRLSESAPGGFVQRLTRE
ncbi:hypothetical protein SAMN03097708_02068 [Thiohalomonas denitrificans]|uniref:Uncharacterized protein n=1 Tax=Thiohalomonas denitrificans TaxID=415747 RepID=A0A1G5QH33_9GAMM|nr:hypothetical protein SAMN03097708_02068 [Thiohalomonas denitrificans]